MSLTVYLFECKNQILLKLQLKLLTLKNIRRVIHRFWHPRIRHGPRFAGNPSFSVLFCFIDHCHVLKIFQNEYELNCCCTAEKHHCNPILCCILTVIALAHGVFDLLYPSKVFFYFFIVIFVPKSQLPILTITLGLYLCLTYFEKIALSPITVLHDSEQYWLRQKIPVKDINGL